jgi:hypothetical protein
MMQHLDSDDKFHIIMVIILITTIFVSGFFATKYETSIVNENIEILRVQEEKLIPFLGKAFKVNNKTYTPIQLSQNGSKMVIVCRSDDNDTLYLDLNSITALSKKEMP